MYATGNKKMLNMLIRNRKLMPETIDESPMAYKGMDEIAANIGPKAEIVKVIKPIYNFKADH